MTISCPDEGAPELQAWLHETQQVPDHVKVANNLKAAEFHWHFGQGIRAIDAELYVPGALALLAGIEASIRWTLKRPNQNEQPFVQDLGATISNALLRQAHGEGLPIELLSFPGETDFLANLKSKKPDVQLVKIRHDLAHGNVQQFINRELGNDMAFFTPECLRPLALVLRQMAISWTEGLSAFRQTQLKQPSESIFL